MLGIRGQRRSGASRQCGPPSLASTCRCCAKAHHARTTAALVDVAGRALRRTWTAHWRRQYVEVLALAQAPKNVSPLPRPPRAVRSHHRWSWHDRLLCNAWSGPPQWRITPGFRPCFSRRKLTVGGSGKQRDDFNHVSSPGFRGSRGWRLPVSLQHPLYYVRACLQYAWICLFIKATHMLSRTF